jgi:hypothetical protein
MRAQRAPYGATWPRRLSLLCVSLLGLCVALSACAPWQTREPVRAVSYQTSREQVPRTVGKLRRLAALQVRVVPRGCADSTDGLGQLTALDATARELLAQRKGYELLEPDAAHPLAGVGDPLDATSRTLVAELLAAKDAAQAPGPALAAWLGRLRESEGVDGLLVLKLETVCYKAMPVTRVLGALLSFGVTEALGHKTEPVAEYLDAMVFETASARMVWRNVYGQLEQALVEPRVKDDGPGRMAAVRAWSIEHVLGVIEPAVPRLLTR